MKNIPLLIGTMVGTLILVVMVAMMFSQNNPNTAQMQTVDQTVLLAGATRVDGPVSAPVTIVEFGDYQCPACAATHPLIKGIKSQYGDRVRLVHRNFPLYDIHPLAQLSAQAAEAAGAQNKFWEMHNLLYERQQEWSELSESDFRTKLGEYAAQIQIDKVKFLETIDATATKDVILADVILGGQLNVNSTPTFFVNGVQTPAPQLRAAVESALTGGSK
jgi:protein-disulfide isomerase